MNVACPSCGEKGKLPKQLIGLKIKCKKCGTSFTVAEPGAKVAFDPDATEPYATVDGIAVAGLDDASWAAPTPAPGPAASPATLTAEPMVQASEPEPSGSMFMASPLEESNPNPNPKPMTIKQYKILTPKDKWFENKFDLSRLEAALNHFAKEGWAVRSMVTPHLATFSGTREELVILLERECPAGS